MTWHKEELDSGELREFARRYRCDALTAAVLARRKVTEPEPALFFLEEDPRFLHNPFAFRQMEAAVERVDAAVSSGERIFVLGDRDVDGVTATVLLYETLTDLGAEVDCGVPEGDDDYGLSNEWVRRIHESGATLLVTVDCGVSNAAEIARATELGIDTIVTDHHNPPAELPECVAVLDPKLEDSGYPFRDLSGCGVAFKLACALRFARTSFFGQTICLLHAKPTNQAVAIEAVKLHNLERVDEVSVQIVPGMIDYDSSPLRDFLAGYEIVVYDGEYTTQQLRRAFGQVPGADMEDISEMIWSQFPGLRGKSLLQAMEASVTARYSSTTPREIDVLASLFVSLVHKRESSAFGDAWRGLDLAALGTLADLMPLVDENRIIVRRGLRMLQDSGRRGLRELLAVRGLAGKRVDSRDVAWKISPVLNAAGRMGQAGEALALLLASNAEEAGAKTESLLSLNRTRKSLGDTVWDWCAREGARFMEETGGRLVYVCSEEIHRGITGILAYRLSGYLRCPAMVVAVVGERAIGSVRSSQEYSLAGFLDRFDDILASYGGHDFAAGFNLPASRTEELRRRAADVGPTIELAGPKEERLDVDAEIPSRLLTPAVIDVVARLEPYGEGNPPLRFMTRDFRIESIDLVGRNGAKHAKLLLSGGSFKWPAVYWNGAEKVTGAFEVGDAVQVVYRLGRNYYMSTESLQLTILDIRK